MNSDARELSANFDLEKLTAEFYANPYPTYRALRENEPVKRMPNGSYFLTRYDDLVSAYKATKVFSSDKKKEFAPKYGDSLLYEHHTTSLVFNDPPAHTRVRRLIMGALSPRAIAAMEPDLIRLVDGLLDRLAAKDKFDLIDDFASAIPIEVIGNLLDVPHDEREPLRDWSLAILGALEPVIAAEVFDRGNKAVKDFLGYLEILVERRRAKPGNPERDVLTRLIQGEDNGERLTSKELLHNCIFLLNAGHETTTNLIGNGLVALSHYPHQKARLIENPAHDQDRDRGDAAVRKLQPARQPHDRRAGRTRRHRDAGGHAGDAVHRRRQSRSRISLPILKISTSAAPRTGISPSAPARINAPGWRWRGSKARSRSRASWRGFRIMRSMASRCAAAGSASADSLSVPCAAG